jgi:chromate transporter
VAGLPGALAATIGIFLPSFLFVAFLNPLISRLRKSKAMSVFMDAVNVVSVVLILAVCAEMAKASVTDWRTIVIAVLGFAITLKYKDLNSAFVILGGAILGYLFWLI